MKFLDLKKSYENDLQTIECKYLGWSEKKMQVCYPRWDLVMNSTWAPYLQGTINCVQWLKLDVDVTRLCNTPKPDGVMYGACLPGVSGGKWCVSLSVISPLWSDTIQETCDQIEEKQRED